METSEIINIWKSYDKKLNESLLFNKKNAEDITKLKVKSFLQGMRPLKIFLVIFSIIWVILVDIIIFYLFGIANLFFIISAAIHVLIIKLAIGIYVYQLALIQQVDISEPVLTTQNKLSKLLASTILVVRISFLQLPVWTTFYWNNTMLENGNFWFYAIQFTVTALMTYLAFWLFFNLKYENKDKKWFRMLLNGIEWTPVIKSMELLNQIKEYGIENKNAD